MSTMTTEPTTTAPTTTAPTTGLPGRPGTTFAGLAYDAFDALAVARFWAAALRVDVAPGASVGRAELTGGPAAGVPHLVFRQVTDPRTARTPLHLQLTTDDLDAEAKRLQRLGARRLGGVSDRGRRWVTLADPEGNTFDLMAA